MKKNVLFYLFCCLAIVGKTTVAFAQQENQKIKVDGKSLFSEVKKIEDKIDKGLDLKNGLLIEIEPGYYNYTETIILNSKFKGDRDNPIIFKVKGGGKAVFNGGIPLVNRINPPSWTVVM